MRYRDRAFRHVNRKDCLGLGIRHDELRALSVRNLTRRRPKPEVKPGRAGAILVMDQNLESSLLLVDHLLVRRNKSWHAFDGS